MKIPSKRQRDAYAQYLEGLRLDEEETTRDRAEQAYRRAIELDPRLATALTNLGNLRLVAGDRAEAESMYRRAIAADPSQAEAPYNLAYLLVERGLHNEAVPLFERALSLRPDFAEAHFNLAMALTEVGKKDRARAHWQRYRDMLVAQLPDASEATRQIIAQRVAAMDNTDMDLRWRKHVVADFVGYALRELRGDDMSATRIRTARQAL